FQAEDGIRAFHVTGVQTCALPISQAVTNSLIDNGAFTQWGTALGPSDPWTFWRDTRAGWTAGRLHEVDLALPANPDGINNAMGRSEERRVGKACSAECRSLRITMK